MASFMKLFIALLFTFTTVLAAAIPADDLLVDPSNNVTLTRRASADELGVLKAHNDVRRQYKKQPLTWDDRLAADARAYAKVLASRGCALKHTTSAQRPGQGENLHMSASSRPAHPPMSDAVKGFCSQQEKDQWFRQRQFNHFTQVIWGETKTVGCGRADGTGGFNGRYPHCVAVVCRYGPPGNFRGRNP
ncbi:hypothetical protein HDU97_006355 [Phlyctochytrium planicorne]|nr:hypothetical protein HDU97_006355 [Phlyctochytrium planicorne]